MAAEPLAEAACAPEEMGKKQDSSKAWVIDDCDGERRQLNWIRSISVTPYADLLAFLLERTRNAQHTFWIAVTHLVHDLYEQECFLHLQFLEQVLASLPLLDAKAMYLLLDRYLIDMLKPTYSPNKERAVVNANDFSETLISTYLEQAYLHSLLAHPGRCEYPIRKMRPTLLIYCGYSEISPGWCGILLVYVAPPRFLTNECHYHVNESCFLKSPANAYFIEYYEVSLERNSVPISKWCSTTSKHSEEYWNNLKQRETFFYSLNKLLSELFSSYQRYLVPQQPLHENIEDGLEWLNSFVLDLRKEKGK